MVSIVQSNSRGNCYFYFNVMVDCGVSYKKLKKELLNRQCNTIFITHIHSDHLNIRTLKMIIANYAGTIKIFGNRQVVERLAEHDIRCQLVLDGDLIKLNKVGVEVNVIPAFHNVMCNGFAFNFNGVKILHITDTNKVSHIKTKDPFDLVVMECNHDADIINNKLALLHSIDGPLDSKQMAKSIYLVGALNNHLSKDKAFAWLEINKPKNVFLAHKSSENLEEI